MWTNRISMKKIAAFTLLACGLGGQANAQTKAEDILARKPIQPNANVATPTNAELAGLKAEQVNWPKQGNVTPSGVVVKDSQGRLVRQFIDTTGQGRPNIWSFYLNGVEVYREIDGNGNGKPDQYRWYGQNGTRWGIDNDEDGTVDTWYTISQEEVSQELFAAIISKDAKRLDALLPTEGDLKAIGLPAAEIAKIRDRAAGAAKKLAETSEKLKLNASAKWIHLESGMPQSTPKELLGSQDDLIKQRSGSVLIDRGDGKNAEVFSTGELVLIGRSWKVIEGPTPGAATASADEGTATFGVPEAARGLLQQIADLKVPTEAGEMPKYHAARAAILEKIVAVVQGADQEPWLKQVVDAYAASAEGGSPEALGRLKQWAEQIEKSAPKSGAASYAQFRVLSADYTLMLPKAKDQEDLSKVQKTWREVLENFIAKHPASDEAPEAMSRLAVAYEYARDGETPAKNWYEKLAVSFPNHPYAAKAKGAVKRLTSEGQVFTMAGQTLDGKAFDMSDLNGKSVLVYYYANWGRDATGELKQIAELAKTFGPKGLVVVTISLDDEPAKATAAINAAQLPGYHLHMAGGLDRSPLAVSYGIQMVPHMFLIGKDGKVTNRNAQNGPNLKDEIEKLVK
jgi:peroxiredoxin